MARILPRALARTLTSGISATCLAFAALTLTGCGDTPASSTPPPNTPPPNTPPSVDTFTVTAPAKGADGNYVMTASVAVSDPDQHKILRLDLSASGPAIIPTQSIAIPGGAAGTYPIRLTLAGNAPGGAYTLSAVAYDEQGAASAAKTATFTLP
ncbi:MAG: hypothetical protein IPQ09_09995 [Myxococcales bacterium]|nr:hypothetical protein [Myxococcales bacterium]